LKQVGARHARALALHSWWGCMYYSNTGQAVPMAKADIAAVLARAAALFIAIGDVIHQRQAHEATDEPVAGEPVRHHRVLRNSRVHAAVVGFALQATASRLFCARAGGRRDGGLDCCAGPRRRDPVAETGGSASVNPC
jgi:hypothetical protein